MSSPCHQLKEGEKWSKKEVMISNTARSQADRLDFKDCAVQKKNNNNNNNNNVSPQLMGMCLKFLEKLSFLPDFPKIKTSERRFGCISSQTSRKVPSPCMNKFPSTIMKQQFCQPPTRHQVTLFPPLQSGSPFSPACWWRHLPAWALQSPFSASSHRAWSVSTRYSSLSLGSEAPRWRLVDDFSGFRRGRARANFSAVLISNGNMFFENGTAGQSNKAWRFVCSECVCVFFMFQRTYCTFVQVHSFRFRRWYPKKNGKSTSKKRKVLQDFGTFLIWGSFPSLPSWYFCIYQLKNLHSLKRTVRTWKHAIPKGN